jgi:hypothetical protein
MKKLLCLSYPHNLSTSRPIRVSFYLSTSRIIPLCFLLLSQYITSFIHHLIKTEIQETGMLTKMLQLIFIVYPVVQTGYARVLNVTAQ